MSNGVKQTAHFQRSMNTLMPLMASHNGTFRLPDNYGITRTQPPPPGPSCSSRFLTLQAISPDLLRTGHEQSTVSAFSHVERTSYLTELVGGATDFPSPKRF